MYFWSYDEGALDDGQIRIDTLYTGLSAGTELTFFKGTNPYLHGCWDGERGSFVPGEPTQRFPVPFLGYMEVGRVAQSRSPSVPEGCVVAMTYGHKSGHTAHPAHEFLVMLPDEIDPILGVYVGQMGPICANGLLHAAVDAVGPATQDLGDGVRGRAVLVTGGGVIGLLTALWARTLGAAEVAVADSTPERLEAARALGVLAVDQRTTPVGEWCKERWHHAPGERGADIVLQCRGQESSLQTALQSLRPQGTVIDLAFYQGGSPSVCLGQEFHHNGLRIQCAQINRVPRGTAHLWGRRRLASETLELLRQHGALIRQQLISDVVPFEQAPALIADLAERRRHVLQAVFEVST
jgi:threonine dehydrogenase-like Zn-dependent dehydrogenase